jgi:hypothetical protein
MDYIINGPNNVIRLTHDDKVLYIFGDCHMPTENQRECPLNDEYDSIDLDKLLFKFMKEEKEKEFDLFIEDYEYYFTPQFNNTYRRRYIDQIGKLVKSNINIVNNKIITNRKYNNFRFHYFDIRNTLFLDNQFYNYGTIYYNFPYSINNCNDIKNITLNLITELTEFYNYSKEGNKHNKFIDKILNKYENKNIQKIINKIYNDVFIKNITAIIKNSHELISLIEKSIDKLKKNFYDIEKTIDLVKPIFIKFKDNQYNILDLTAVLTDLYFLRRFLDKPYIKNGILYTGIAHLSDLTYLLTKYFNYKITNIYYINQLSKNDLSKKIIKMKTEKFSYLKELSKYFYNYDENFEIKQCVDLLEFPKKFN